MLAPKLLAALETANGTAGLDGAHRCLLQHVKLFAVALYRIRYKRLREIRGENNRALYHRTAGRDRFETHNDSCEHGHMPLHQESELRILLTRSTRWSDPHCLEIQEKPPKTRHCPDTCWRARPGPRPIGLHCCCLHGPHATIAADAMDSDENLLTVHDDTVYDNAYDTDDNVYDVYYDVHEEMDVDYRDPPGATRPDGPWPDGIR